MNRAPVIEAAVHADAPVLPSSDAAPSAEEEPPEAVAQLRAEGLGVGDAAELWPVTQLLLPTHAAIEEVV